LANTKIAPAAAEHAGREDLVDDARPGPYAAAMNDDDDWGGHRKSKYTGVPDLSIGPSRAKMEWSGD
jgi:hypothetical protein